MTVRKAYLFVDGTIMAFGKDWKIIPEYQGPDTDIIPKLRRDYPELVIERANWVEFRDAPPEVDAERWRRLRRTIVRIFGGVVLSLTATIVRFSIVAVLSLIATFGDLRNVSSLVVANSRSALIASPSMARTTFSVAPVRCATPPIDAAIQCWPPLFGVRPAVGVAGPP
jgi:hypothetical protein